MKNSIPSASREKEGLRVPGISWEREFPLMAAPTVGQQAQIKEKYIFFLYFA